MVEEGKHCKLRRRWCRQSSRWWRLVGDEVDQRDLVLVIEDGAGALFLKLKVELRVPDLDDRSGLPGRCRRQRWSSEAGRRRRRGMVLRSSEWTFMILDLVVEGFNGSADPSPGLNGPRQVLRQCRRCIFGGQARRGGRAKEAKGKALSWRCSFEETKVCVWNTVDLQCFIIKNGVFQMVSLFVTWSCRDVCGSCKF